jgi:L-ribulose-5-phosphate 4-epimerase
MPELSIEELKQKVWLANLALVKAGLVILTWGNVSAVDRERRIIAIKPSGVDYDVFKPEDIVLVSLDSGQALPRQTMRPSSDTPTHVHLYNNFIKIGGIAHTHSRNATSWAQACREIPCYGTTHADTFYGAVPIVRALSPYEIEQGYERNTGVAIIEHFRTKHLDPLHVPGALLSYHAPFAWGATVEKAVESAIILEEVAALALNTERIAKDAKPAPQSLIEKHYLRKHGPAAYYGQPGERVQVDKLI